MPSRLRGGRSSIGTGHRFHTASQSDFRLILRRRTTSPSASKLASNWSPGEAGARATGMLTRCFASTVTITVESLSCQTGPGSYWLEAVPVVRGNGPVQDGFDLTQKEAELKHRKLLIRRNGLPVLLEDEELMAGSAVGAVKSKSGESAEELTPLDGLQSEHGRVGSG
jgi:hypothetical protein